MIVEAIKRSMIGIAYGGIITFIALTVLKYTNTEAPVSQIWLYMLCSFIIGIYFGLSSLIFTENSLSLLKQTVVHFIMSIVFYFIIALSAGWIPLTAAAIIGTSLFFIFIYAVFWTGYYLYYKKVEESMNANLPRK
ncbi:DUF3021 domain-containing protein [Lentibacillus salicampi]|uniref:DUF3021 domain-containing protein n=1 Tax=Lentibacillus salicampi TaxID=175306 RepID=A0A4Y9A7Y4_9BACI|nr:DUF3021 domain-containing protein [Lentibacillus salicampi]TFJ91853.1 DUF3021 domain-containing protein [Lentibacillus salicampi]